MSSCRMRHLAASMHRCCRPSRLYPHKNRVKQEHSSFYPCLSSFRFFRDDVGSHLHGTVFNDSGCTLARRYRQFQFKGAGHPPKETPTIAENMASLSSLVSSSILDRNRKASPRRRAFAQLRTFEVATKDPATADPHFRNTTARETVGTAWGQKGAGKSGERKPQATDNNQSSKVVSHSLRAGRRKARGGGGMVRWSTILLRRCGG